RARDPVGDVQRPPGGGLGELAAADENEVLTDGIAGEAAALIETLRALGVEAGGSEFVSGQDVVLEAGEAGPGADEEAEPLAAVDRGVPDGEQIQRVRNVDAAAVAGVGEGAAARVGDVDVIQDVLCARRLVEADALPEAGHRLGTGEDDGSGGCPARLENATLHIELLSGLEVDLHPGLDREAAIGADIDRSREVGDAQVMENDGGREAAAGDPD